MNQYKINTTDKLDDELVAKWHKLWSEAENPSVFNSPEWFISCINTFKIKNFKIWLMFNNEELVCILPLQQYNRFGVNVYGTISNHYLVDTALLTKSLDTNLLKEFFETITFAHNIFIQKMDEKVTIKLKHIFPSALCSLMSVNPCIKLDNNTFDNISPSTISQVKKTERQNPESFEFKFVGENDDLDKYFEIMIDIEQKSAKKMRAMDIFSDSKTLAFFKALIKNCGKQIRIAFLFVDGKPVSYMFGFLNGNVFAGYQTAYLIEYAKLRPGKIMIYKMIEELPKLGITAIDLGGGISRYKQEFTPEYRLLYNYYYSKNSIAMVWWKTLNGIGRLKKKIVKEKNTRDPEFIFKTLK